MSVVHIFFHTPFV